MHYDSYIYIIIIRLVIINIMHTIRVLIRARRVLTLASMHTTLDSVRP